MKNVAVFAVLRDKPHAEAAVKALGESGFREEDISVLHAENVGAKDFAHEKHSKAPEGAIAGASIGALIGGTLALLAGMGIIALPGLAQYLTAGPVMCALAGIGFGGVAGGILGALIGAGIPEFEAKRYAGLIKEGRSLLSVHCDNSEWVNRAKHALKSVGGAHIVAAGEAGAGFALSRRPRLDYGSAHGSLR